MKLKVDRCAEIIFSPIRRDFEKLKVRFTGFQLLTLVPNLLIAPAVKILISLIKKTVEFRVRSVVEKKLPDLFGNFDFE